MLRFRDAAANGSGVYVERASWCASYQGQLCALPWHEPGLEPAD